jgi:biopolymer transport protein ExbD
MAFSGMGSSGGRGGRGRWRSQVGVLSEMNVVPLVDVVLVLLIIFMVTASVMEFGLNIDVPQVKQVKDTAEEHPVISIARTGATYLNETPVNLHSVGEEVRRRFRGQEAVYLRSDKNVSVGDFLNVVSILDEAKFKVMVVTKPEDRRK